MHAPSEEKSDDDSKDSSSKELGQVLDHLPKYHMKSLLHLNVKLGRKDILKPTIENDCMHQDSNDNCVIIVNFAT